jgi:hypothetical protein
MTYVLRRALCLRTSDHTHALQWFAIKFNHCAIIPT